MKSKIFWPPLLCFFLFMGALESLARLDYLDTQLFPSPTILLRTFLIEKSYIFPAFLETFLHSLESWFLSIFFGTLVALIFSSFEFLKNMILPFAIFFQTVPVIAIAPLLVIYLGYGSPTIIFSAVFVSIFPIIANTLIGLERTQKNYLKLFKVYKISSLRTLFSLKLPFAYSFCYGGIKIASGLSVIGVVAGEFVAGGGLGSLIDSARTQQRIDLVYISLLLLAFTGLVFIGILKILNNFIQKWRPLDIELKD